MTTSEDLKRLADAIRTVTGSSDTMTIPEMSGKVQGIQVGGGSTDDYDTSGYVFTASDLAGITEIGTLFSGRTDIKSVEIPEGVTEIPEDAFLYCSHLVSVTIPSTVTTIGGWAFMGCTSLKTITFPNSVTELQEGVLKGCTRLKSVTLPNTLDAIGTEAFSGCTVLSEITIPDSVTSIGDSAFNGCYSLKSLTIPSNATSVANNFYNECANLESLTLKAVLDYDIRDLPSLKTITVTSGDANVLVTNCLRIKTITSPNLDNISMWGKCIANLDCDNDVYNDIDWEQRGFVRSVSFEDANSCSSNYENASVLIFKDRDSFSNILTSYNWAYLHERSASLRRVYVPSDAWDLLTEKNGDEYQRDGYTRKLNEDGTFYYEDRNYILIPYTGSVPDWKSAVGEDNTQYTWTLGGKVTTKDGTLPEHNIYELIVPSNIPNGTTIDYSSLEYVISITLNCSPTAVSTPTVIPSDFLSDIYVPADKVAAYKSAPGWKAYADIIKAIGS